jgi:hypothetical protein
MFYEASDNEYSIGKFIEHYQNAMPQLVMIRRGYCVHKGNNKITELRTILQRESQSS